MSIELPAGTPEELVEKVIGSCNQALGGERCHSAASMAEPTTLYAIVEWRDSELEISLRRASPDGEEVDSRQVTFSPEDAPLDRYVAAGLMVAALTAAQSIREPDEAPPPAPPVAPPPPPPPVLPEPEAPEPVSRPGWHAGIDLGAAGGQGLDGEPPKWGGEIALWWLGHTPRVGVDAGVSYLGAAVPTTLRWTTLALGCRVRPTPWSSPIGLDISADAVAQYTQASAEQGDLTQSASLWRMGGKLGVLASLDVNPWVVPWVGLHLSLLERGFEVTVAGDSIGAESELRFGASLGLRIMPF